MALNYPILVIFSELASSGKLPSKHVSMLEMGEQNWFGDVHPKEMLNLAKQLGRDAGLIKELEDYFETTPVKNMQGEELFNIAKLFYKVIFDYVDYSAIDLHGTQAAIVHDLNTPVPEELYKKYDIVTNLGTGEHVFNQAGFFENVHNVTKPGGFIFQTLPNQGCYDHGLFNYHPTFVFDLARANRYAIPFFAYIGYNENAPAGNLAARQPILPITSREAYVRMAVNDQLTRHSGMFVVLQKMEDAPFRYPQQAYYNNQLPPDLEKAWSQMIR